MSVIFTDIDFDIFPKQYKRKLIRVLKNEMLYTDDTFLIFSDTKAANAESKVTTMAKSRDASLRGFSDLE